MRSAPLVKRNASASFSRSVFVLLFKPLMLAGVATLVGCGSAAPPSAPFGGGRSTVTTANADSPPSSTNSPSGDPVGSRPSAVSVTSPILSDRQSNPDQLRERPLLDGEGMAASNPLPTDLHSGSATGGPSASTSGLSDLKAAREQNSPLMRGRRLVESGNYRDAISPLQTAVRTNARIPSAHAMLALCYRETGNIPRAISHMTRAIEIAPKNGEFYFLRGVYESADKRFSAARRDYEEALRLGFDSARCRTELAIACIQLQDLPQAQRESQRALDSFPDQPLSYFAVAVVAYHQRDLQASRESLDRAIELGLDERSADQLSRLLEEAAQKSTAPLSNAPPANP